MSGSVSDQHGAVRVPQDLLADRPGDQPGEPAHAATSSSLSSHHTDTDEIRTGSEVPAPVIRTDLAHSPGTPRAAEPEQ